MDKIFTTPKKYKSPAKWTGFILPALVTLVLIIITINRGGFYANINLIMAFVCAAATIIYCIVKRRVRFSSASVLLAVLSLTYLLSMYNNVEIATSLLSVTNTASLIAVALLFAQLNTSRKWDTFCLLTVFGVISSVWGILVGAGAIPMLGGKDDSGLAFVFQYGNAAGVWFALIVVMCFYSLKKWFKLAAILPAVALIMTKSVGACIALAVVAVIFGAVALHNMQIPQALTKIKLSYLVIAVIAVMCAGAAIWIAFLPLPQTFIERFIQIYDSCRVFSAHIFGAGPDTWQFLYPYIQTAQYQAAKVHCSYMQIALDGGIIAIVAFLAYIVLRFISLIKRREYWRLACALLIIVHAAFDFDLVFSAFLLLLLFLLDSTIVDTKKQQNLASKVTTISIASVFLVVSVVAASFGINYFLDINNAKNAVSDVQSGMAPPNVTQLPAYLQQDPQIRGNLTAACSIVKGNTYVLNDQATLSGEEAWYKANAFGNAGNYDSAYNILLTEMAKQLYNYDFADKVREYLIEHNATQNYIDRYNAIADKCNEAIEQSPANLLNNQKTIDLI